MKTDAEIKPGLDTSLVELLAGVLGIGLTVYDKNDILLTATREMKEFLPGVAHVLVPGVRLREVLGAAYDSGDFKPAMASSAGTASRDDWIADRLALHWRERYESLDRLADGRWVRTARRRLASGILISTLTDVTEIRQREIEYSSLREKAELAQRTLDHLPDPVVVKDASLRYVLVNDAFCHLTGLHPNSLLGKTAAHVTDPETARGFEQEEREILETGAPIDRVKHLYRTDGSRFRTRARKRRIGTPGNYHIIVSIDEPSLANETDGSAAGGGASGAKARVASGRHSPGQDHILVIDENPTRAEATVAALRAGGNDAFAVHEAREAVAVLDAARSMGVIVSEVRCTSAMSAELACLGQANAHPLLASHVESARRPDPAAMEVPAKQAEIPTQHGIRADQDAQMPSQPAPGACLGDRLPVSPVTALPRRIRVLVAEDNDVNQIVFQQILDAMEVDYCIVGNGQLAVDHWRTSCPDIILMDVSMPVMNGLDATRMIRSEEIASGSAKSTVPIVAVTAHAMSGDRDRCFAAGMDDYVSKPVSPEKLELVICTWTNCPDLALGRTG